MNRYTTAIFIAAISAATTSAELIYDIDFSQFSAPSSYINAGGQPHDFSGYVGQTSVVVSAFQGLTEQPLVSVTTQASASNRLGLDAPGFTNHILTLALDLVLESSPDPTFGPNALVGFFAPGDNLYNSTFALPIAFGLVPGWSISTSNLLVDTGYFTTNTTFIRDSVLSLVISANTADHILNVTVNGNPIAVNAPYDPAITIVGATIRIGDIITSGSVGEGAIDNITLTATIVPEPSTLLLICLGGIGIARVHSIRTRKLSLS